jgi:hypothetical protein
MKISFKTDLPGSGPVLFSPARGRPELTDIRGREIRIRLQRNTLSEKLKRGMILTVELPDRQALVTVRDTGLEAEWMVLHCRSKKVFPAIVIGTQVINHAVK